MPRSYASLVFNRPDGNKLTLTADLTSIIEKQGAEFSGAITETLTHLITTPKEVANQSRKCESIPELSQRTAPRGSLERCTILQVTAVWTPY